MLQIAHLITQRGQFVHLQDLDMPAEVSALLGEIAVDVQHAVVVVAHHAETVVLHHMGDPRGVEPLVNLPPGDRVVFDGAGHLIERHPAAIENVRDFRHRTRLAIGKPMAGHLRAVVHLIKRRVIDRRFGCQVQNDHRHLRPSHHRQHRARQGISRDVQKNQIDIGPAEGVAGFEGFDGVID